MNREVNGINDIQPDPLKRASSLLSQQIWCWGQDIQFKDNLLVKYGFERIEKPAGQNVSSIYRLDLSPTARILLRGFGVFIGDDRYGGMFLRRFEFIPRLTVQAELDCQPWTSVDLPKLELPDGNQTEKCQHLLIKLADWIREYEIWIGETMGKSYRQKSLLGWNPKDEITLGESMSLSGKA